MCGADPGLDCAAAEAEVQKGFVVGIMAALEANLDFFLPIPGALDVFGEVREGGWTPAVATGGWRPSAELRLSAAGIPMAGVPLATASEAIHRADIIRLAATQAGSGIEPTEIVYVGDGTWDERACRELSIGFIGRASPDARTNLFDQGARAIIPDFKATKGLFHLLSDPEALIPTGGSV
jgi:phosphoglycolate phosphatase-like HAD superfamily hydrolase